MPVHGKVYAYVPVKSIFNMEVGETKALDVDDLIVTHQAVFIDFASPVTDLSNEDDDEDTDYIIKVTRLGDGVTEDDFALDLTGLSKNHSFLLETEAVYLDCKKHNETFLMFTTSIDLEIIEEEETLEQLEEKLAKAIEDEDFKKAARVRKKIDKKNAETENK